MPPNSSTKQFVYENIFAVTQNICLLSQLTKVDTIPAMQIPLMDILEF